MGTLSSPPPKQHFDGQPKLFDAYSKGSDFT